MESAAHNLGVLPMPHRCEFSKGFQCWLIVRFVQQLWMKSEMASERAQQAECGICCESVLLLLLPLL